MNKKTFGIIGVVVLIILLIICCSIKPNTKETTDSTEDIIEKVTRESQEVKEKEKKEFTEINVEEYLNKYNDEEKSLVLVARPTCHYCQIAEPIIHNIAYKYDLTINYLNTDNFKDDDSQRFIQSDEFFSNGFGTPMLLIVSNGKIDDMVDGVTDTKHYEEFLKNNSFIE
jgi:thiol-disulfide isomerase/thioredoxin